MMYVYIYIWHCCLLSCRFFQFHHKSKDWTLWGSRLAVEGRSIPVFLVAFLGEGCMCMMIVSCHHASYLVALCMCFVPRCKLLLQEPPDLALHENVLQFPQEKMADLLRTPVLFVHATKPNMTEPALHSFWRYNVWDAGHSESGSHPLWISYLKEPSVSVARVISFGDQVTYHGCAVLFSFVYMRLCWM